MVRKECIYCIKRKTEYCPNSSECYLLENVPYFQTKYDVLKENQELKKQKEFIEWLESKNFLGQIPVEQVFSKYKEIIGVSDEQR